jgi:asparagine N-glycosylation enzyme membrane subunit Stt3
VTRRTAAPFENRATFAAILFVAIALSALAREIQHQRIDRGSAPWITVDPDSLYHFRRVERALADHGRVAERDPYLNFPHGSPIPWPPYYTFLSWSVFAPFAPREPEALRAFVETRVASLPFVFGVLTSVLAALAGRLLAGNAAALLAGAIHALSIASIAYSKSGNGDHHAWVTFLSALLLILFSTALQRKALERRSASALSGVAMGVVAGVALGSWVASVLYLVPIQLALGLLLLRRTWRESTGLPALGTAFHVAALVVLVPATLQSAWKEVSPWMVVNLTWFHLAWLALGAAVFLPLLVLPVSARRSYPWLVTAALLALGIYLATGQGDLAQGVREGFAWLSREEDFMATVWESRSMLGEGAVHSVLDVLGLGILLLPVAWIAAAADLLRRERIELLPWVVAVPLLLGQALRQFRFTDALSLPMAVLLAWGAVAFAGSSRIAHFTRIARRAPAWALFAVLLGVVGAAQWKSTSILLRGFAVPASRGTRERMSTLAMRDMCDWIRHRSPASGDYSVMAPWFHGHMVEWAADRPTVGTNFGSYVGEDSFRDPSRFFLLEDPSRAEELLGRRHARYVVLTSDLTGALDMMIRSTEPQLATRYLEPHDSTRLRLEWFRTIGARLMFDGTIFSYEGDFSRPIDFLRLVHVSPLRDDAQMLRGRASPLGWVWERVPGATLEARGTPGDVLRVEVGIRYPDGKYALTWRDEIPADENGIARLRVPYATEAPNGDGYAEGPARWSFGESQGTLAIPEEAVIHGGLARVI